MGVLRRIWESFLRHLGILPCCEKPDIQIYDQFYGGFARCQNCGWERPYVPLGL